MNRTSQSSLSQKPSPTLVSIVGTRPQFIKAAPVSLALKEAGINEIAIHTGQHYDTNMSAVFYEQLGMAAPRHSLNIGSGTHAHQTGEGLKAIESILLETQPDGVLVYGDTNATIAGALAAVKLHIPVAHVEAGLRSFNRRMPEEINRVVTDHVSTWLYTPTATATEQLALEGITDGVVEVGDVMLDAALMFGPLAEEHLADWMDVQQLQTHPYWLLTMHRAETTAHPQQVTELLQTIDQLGHRVIFPIHPRVKPLVEAAGSFQHIECIEPLGYLEMLLMERFAQRIITDSGGVQKEAAFAQVPCITLRSETEWVETVTSGWNTLVGLDPQQLKQALMHPASRPTSSLLSCYGSGSARHAIAHHLASVLKASVPAPQVLSV